MTKYVESCRCGNAPDYECESTKVGEARTGPDGVTVQPYLKFFLCLTCLRGAVSGPTPPRKVTPLPHEATRIRNEKRKAQAALLGKVEVVRLGDWGHKGQTYSRTERAGAESLVPDTGRTQP